MQSDSEGGQLWRRPGKEANGWSARASDDCLWVFSSNADLDPDVPYSKQAAYAILHEDMDPVEALQLYGTADQVRKAKVQASQDGWAAQVGLTAEKLAERAARFGAADSNGQNPPGPNIHDPQLGDGGNVFLPGSAPYVAASLNLPESFWEALPVLRHIRQAAHCRCTSADAVLGAVMARLAAMWPPWYRIDTGSKNPASANLYVVPAGMPGLGKSTATSPARALLPYLVHYNGLMTAPGGDRGPHPSFADGLPLGSGEGLAEMYMTAVVIRDEKGKSHTERHKTRDHAFVMLDEGGALAAALQRMGSTIGPTLRSAWVGETIGQSNASAETTRRVPEGSYSLGMVIGFQPSTAGLLLADSAAGTPQRFVYMHAADPSVPDEACGWPGPLKIAWPSRISDVYGWDDLLFGVADPVKREIREQLLARLRGKVQAEPGAEHDNLTRAKLGAILAALDGRMFLDEEIWALTGVMWQTSCAVRDWLAGWGTAQAQQAEQWARQIGAGRKVAEAEALDQRVMYCACRSAGRHVHKKACPGGCKRRCITQALSGNARKTITVDEVIDQLLATGVIQTAGDSYIPGSMTPG